MFPPCRLHGINSLLQLIRSRYVTSLNDSGSPVAIHHPKEPTAKFQLAQLEQDIIAIFIAGKPHIHNESPSQLRTLFKFKSSDKDTDRIHFKYVYSIEKGINFTNIFSSYYSLVNLALDVNEMTEKLPEEYKTPVEETVQKQLEYQFHSADYHTMLQIITGLKTALRHLIKVSAILSTPGLYHKTLIICSNNYATTFGETLNSTWHQPAIPANVCI